ncbi:hypothetical protein MTR67_039491 [Solanum verrucosum]|uniref:Uncharacterized protein n=1 Tax=Solanum verrucosum TaxID=315347 RepID=A0AAF0UIJ3_SOLVR|nr:hypothetical protein MTR67_039491 [Solanum verrucosum]
MVQAIQGYPEYFRTSQLKEKSDVCSCEVVLAEYLIGMKPISREINYMNCNLEDYFVSCMRENQLFQILDRYMVREGSLEQLKNVVELVKYFLSLHGEGRPTMKEVAMEL